MTTPIISLPRCNEAGQPPAVPAVLPCVRRPRHRSLATAFSMNLDSTLWACIDIVVVSGANQPHGTDGNGTTVVINPRLPRQLRVLERSRKRAYR